MIELIVLLGIVLFIIFILGSFIAWPVIISLNIILIIALVVFIVKDIKEENMGRYYMAGLLLTAVTFVLGNYSVFRLVISSLKNRLFLSEITMAFLFLHVHANLSMYFDRYRKKAWRKLRKRLREHR